MAESQLLKRTQELLNTTLIPMSRIAKVVGCNPVTLKTIREGKNVPNVVLCEAVYNMLSRDPLEVK